MRPNVSIILTTYNRPLALKQVLLAFNAQSYQSFEVVIADDGSDHKTFEMLADLQKRLDYPLLHCWQEDEGFRAARSRNNALLKSNAEYIVFVDGDCIPSKNFIAEHVSLAEHGWFVRGSRLMLNSQLTTDIETEKIILSELNSFDFIRLYLLKKIKRISPLFKLPLGVLRKTKAQKWFGVKTCNLGVWKKDLIEVNGFDENFEGWGHEDADLAVRLFHSGVRRKEGLYAVPVFHLWHEENDRSHEQQNTERLQAVINSFVVKAKRGLAQHVVT